MGSPSPAPRHRRAPQRDAPAPVPQAPNEAALGSQAGVPRYLDPASDGAGQVQASGLEEPLTSSQEEELETQDSGEVTDTNDADAAPGPRAGGGDGGEEGGSDGGGETPEGEAQEDGAEGESEGEGGERDAGSAAGEGGDGTGGGAGEGDIEAPPEGDMALIDEELAEHERWAGSFGEVGTSGSDERARFLIDQAGRGGVSGAAAGFGMGMLMGAIGGAIGKIAGRRLATLAVSRGASATPIPGLGPAIGGVMALAGLAMRDWTATGKTIDRMGTGEGYERLANDLEGLAEILDVACSVMDVLAGVLGGISVGMWVGAVLSAGALSPLAFTLSAIATGITFATTAVNVIISVAVRPAVTALRALHAFQSRGDPSEIEASGLQLQSAAGQLTGAAAGALGGRIGGHLGARGGTRIDAGVTALQARMRGGRPSMSATGGGPRIHVEMPEAPAASPSATAAGAAPGTTATPTATATPTPTTGPAPSARPRPSSPNPAIPPESFADLDGVVADLNASPEVAARLTDRRAPIAPRATPYGPGEARAYANQQAANHRAATGMSGGEVQAGHTAAARHASESNIPEAAWDTQPMMDLHSRRGKGLDVTVTDPHTGKTGTRTRHTSQEGLIDAAVGRVRDATGAPLTPQGQLDAAAQVAWATENLPYRQQDVERLRTGGLAPPPRGAPVDAATGRVIAPAPNPSGPAASSPRPRTGSATHATSSFASNTQTLQTADRAAAMAQYHTQISADPGRESGVWRGADGTYYVMQGETGSVAPPSASGPLDLVYHSHPTETDAAMRGLNSQPSQAGGDFGVLQYQHGEGTPGRRQTSELHFPVYDDAGNHVGYGATRFAYDPTSPLPLQVTTTMPGGGRSTQRYASFANFEARAGVGASGATPADAANTMSAAQTQLDADVAAARARIDSHGASMTPPRRPLAGMREGADAGGNQATPEADPEAADRPVLGPAYTSAMMGAPGEVLDLPINPAYEPPPGTPEELDALREHVALAQAAQEDLQCTENAMGTQASEQQAQDAQLTEAGGVTQDLASGRATHQSSVDTTQEVNTEQQTTAGDTISSLSEGARQETGVTTLVVSLEAFQGMADLFSYLPGDLGHQAEGASADAGELITTLHRVSEMESTATTVEGARSDMETDAQRIEQVTAQGTGTDEQLATGQEQVSQLQEENAVCLAESESVQEQAADEGAAAAQSEEEAQSTHDDLLTRMQSWAQAHRQAREDAINAALERYHQAGLNAEVSASE